MKTFIRFPLPLGIMLCAVCLFVAGCTTRLNLTMKKDLPLIDQSVISPKLKEKNISRIIIIPPAGTPRSDLEQRILLFERELQKQGITVISGEITGRVVKEAFDKPDDKKAEAVRGLSNMERALAMANATGADAILQLIEFRWVFPHVMTRYFVGEMEDGSEFREVTHDEWRDWPGMKRDFLSPKWIFLGRVVDQVSGEVLATYDLSMPANFTLPEDYRATYLYTPVENRVTKSKLIGEYSFNYVLKSWLPSAMERAENKVMAYVAASIAVPSGAAAAKKSPASTVTSIEGPPQAASKQTAASAPPVPLPAAPGKLYVIQIRAFQTMKATKKYAEEVRKTHPDVQWTQATIKDKGVWYRVFIGGFKTRNEALKYRNAKGVQKRYPDSFIRIIEAPVSPPAS